MSKIIWDEESKRVFETGVDRAVLYPFKENEYQAGVAWNGLLGVTEKPSGAELKDMWADNIKYASIRAAETFEASVEAYTYPDEFMACDGSAELAPGIRVGQQKREPFGLTYRSRAGSDTDPEMTAYKIHIIYGATVAPSERAYKTINESPDAITFSWSVKTTPVKVKDHKPTASMEIDSRKVNKEKLAKLEEALYGSDTEQPSLPTPDEVLELLG